MILDTVEINKERGRDRSIKMKVLSDDLDDLKVLVRLATVNYEIKNLIFW